MVVGRSSAVVGAVVVGVVGAIVVVGGRVVVVDGAAAPTKAAVRSAGATALVAVADPTKRAAPATIPTIDAGKRS